MFSSEFGPGTVVADRFEIENEAGSGGMGVVYRAKDQSTGAPVALKLLKTRNDQPSRIRFTREALLLAELRHPGIVSYVAHGQLPDGRSYLVMDWLAGEELATRLHRGPLTLSRAVALLQRLADALAAAHRRGVIHRDLKPSNIFLVNGQVEHAVLVDFGIARHAAGDRIVTGTGVIVGTPGYMAPEQARADSTIEPCADIFSLGCVLYQCLTGQPPFVAEHVAGDTSRAHEALREALWQLELCTSKITDPVVRTRYLAGRPENARVLSLARDWLDDEETNQHPIIRMSLPSTSTLR